MSWIVDSGYNILAQEQEQSCGYCCVGMVLNQFDTSARHSEQSLVATGTRLSPGAYDRAAHNRVGAVQTFIVQSVYEQRGVLPHWGSGTYGNHLAQVLRDYRIDATYQTGSVKAAMRSVGPGRPVIALVNWDQGGGHWVVVVARATRGLGQASDYTILDPAGHTVINRGSTTYAPPYDQGVFANYYVTVKGRLASPKGVKLPGMA